MCREMILDKKLTVDRVATRIIEEYEDFLNIMFSDENAQNLVLRIRCGMEAFGGQRGLAWYVLFVDVGRALESAKR